MKVVEELEGLCITLFCALNSLWLRELIAPWSFRVRQVAFSAALGVMRHKVLFVVLLAVIQRGQKLPWIAA